MSLSLNEVITRMKTIALDLRAINSFIEEENETSVDTVYPAVISQKQPGSISRTNKQTVLNFKLFFVDLLTDTNRLEIQSDMLSTAVDFKALMEDDDNEWDVSENTPLNFIDNKFNEDDVAGVQIDISIGVRYLSDRCQVPLKSDDAETFITNNDGEYIQMNGGLLTT